VDNDGVLSNPNLVPIEDADAQETALAGIRMKLQRSNSQLDRLYVEMNGFSDQMPYALGDPKPNADHTQWVYPVRFRRPIPLTWAVILGEVVHNLRSALDHSIFQLTLEYTGKELEGTAFPISDKPTSWDLNARHQLRGVGCGVVDYVKRLQPYSTSHPYASALWALHLLWNQDKHRLLNSWGLQLVEEGSDLRFDGAEHAYRIKLATELLHDGDDAITSSFDGPAVRGALNGRLKTKLAFDNPADRRPGVSDRVWRLHDATAGVVGTLLAAIGRQDEPIP
jgi:hypothetical protein